jgi:hypothetical protein
MPRPTDVGLDCEVEVKKLCKRYKVDLREEPIHPDVYLNIEEVLDARDD